MNPMLTMTNSLNREQSRAQAGETGGHKEIEGIGLDVTAEFSTARFFRCFVFLVCTACANVEGLHRDVSCTRMGWFNEKGKT